MDLSNFKEAIIFAIRKEQDAATMYETYGNVARNLGAKRMFADLAKEELKHKKLLEGVTPEDIEDYKLTKVPNLKIAEYSVDEEFSPDMTYQDALLLAIKKEEKSYKLYHSLIKGTAHPQLQKLFQTLATEESKHKLKLETEYDENVLKEG